MPGDETPFKPHLESEESRYGSDKHGLVWGYLFTPGQPGRPLDSDAAAESLAAQTRAPSDSFLWLHFSLSNANSEGWVREHLTLPETFYESVHEAESSTRLEQEGDALVAVIHDVLFDFTFDPEDVSTVILCITPRLLVSARLKPLRSVDRLRASIKSGQTFRSAAELLAHLLRDQANVLMDIVRQSTQRVNTIEDELLNNRITASRRELGNLRRVLVRLQRLLAPEPAALFRLLSRPPDWIGGEDVQDLREAAEEFAAAAADSAALVERVRLIQEELGARINEKAGRTLFVLTVVTVLALPINMVAGLFGMNVGGIPLSQHPNGFFVVVGTLLALTALLAYLTLGRQRD